MKIPNQPESASPRRRSIPWVSFYPSNWRGGTAHLTGIQELLYFRLCCFMWDIGQPFDERDLPGLMRGEMDGVADALDALCRMGKLRRDGHDIVCDRAIQAYEDATVVRAARSERARAGAQARHKQGTSKAPAEHKHGESESESERSPPGPPPCLGGAPPSRRSRKRRETATETIERMEREGKI